MPTLGDWYMSLSSTVIDLVGDYAGKELFLIEGDSLVLQCFDDSKLDFKGIYFLSSGPEDVS